jgi:putative flippase GtrA
MGRRPPGAGTWRQVSRFAAVGAVSTVLHLGLFASLVAALASAQTANLAALLVATVANTALNRRWTFGIRGAGRLRSQVQGLAVFGLTWLLTAGALALLHSAVAAPSTALATVVVGTATAASTVVRFVAMRSWIFRTPGPPAGQYSVTMNVPSSSSNTTTPVQSNPSTEPWQTVTSP